mmetsp:Transcript_25947/g.82349  ORF Transcript_25947/g.82349 Transcript_25947/m.82349 type:complete len:242 (+) Transcript_25947:328-1053(+)
MVHVSAVSVAATWLTYSSNTSVTVPVPRSTSAELSVGDVASATTDPMLSVLPARLLLATSAKALPVNVTWKLTLLIESATSASRTAIDATVSVTLPSCALAGVADDIDWPFTVICDWSTVGTCSSNVRVSTFWPRSKLALLNTGALLSPVDPSRARDATASLVFCDTSVIAAALACSVGAVAPLFVCEMSWPRVVSPSDTTNVSTPDVAPELSTALISTTVPSLAMSASWAMSKPSTVSLA